MTLKSTLASGAVGRAPRLRATVSLADTTAQTGAAATFTFTSRSLGSPHKSRVIFVGVSQRNVAAPASSVTVAGVSATFVAAKSGVASNNRAELWAVHLPAGTTGTIVVNWSATVPRCAIAVFRVVNLLSLTPTDAKSSNADPAVVSLNVKRGGCAIGWGYFGNTGTNTWTGLTEVVDAQIDTQSYSAAIGNFTEVQSALSVTVDGSNAYQDPAMVVVALR